MDREQALDVALGQIERQLRQGRRDEDERPGARLGRRDLDGVALARPRARHRRAAARPHRRDLRPRVLGQDDARLPRDRRGAAPRRHLRLHRRRARDGPDLREADRRQHRRPARLAARHRRAGARDHRAPDPLRRARRRRDRLGRRADAEGRDRGRDGRLPRRPPGAADVAGAPQARRHAQPHRHDLHLHEPAAREDRRHVRQSRRRRRAAARSSSTRRSGSTSAASRRSRTASRRSATACRVKVAKNKVAPPFKQAEFDIMYGEGISWEGTVLDTGLDRKIVQKSGSYFSFGDERLGQGRQNATAFLKEHPDLVQQILQGIQATMAARADRLGAAAAAGRGGRRHASCRRGRESRPRPKRRPRPRPRRSDVAAARDGARRRAARPRARRARRRARGASCRRPRSSAPGSRSGRELDRPRARTLRRELAARRGARDRDGRARPARPLGARASPRSSSGAASRRSERARALDDARARRLRRRRAASPPRAPTALAERGYGDEAIRFDLERHGLGDEPRRLGARRARARERSVRASSWPGRGRIAEDGAWLAAKGFSADPSRAAVGDPGRLRRGRLASKRECVSYVLALLARRRGVPRAGHGIPAEAPTARSRRWPRRSHGQGSVHYVSIQTRGHRRALTMVCDAAANLGIQRITTARAQRAATSRSSWRSARRTSAATRSRSAVHAPPREPTRHGTRDSVAARSRSSRTSLPDRRRGAVRSPRLAACARRDARRVSRRELDGQAARRSRGALGPQAMNARRHALGCSDEASRSRSEVLTVQDARSSTAATHSRHVGAGTGLCRYRVA